jgi:hypothetical protein
MRFTRPTPWPARCESHLPQRSGAQALELLSTGIVGSIAVWDARPTEEVSMRTIHCAIVLGAALLVAAPSAQAQHRRARGNVSRSSSIPKGMCQVWIITRDGRRQPALTSCAAARGYAPWSSRLVRGNALRTGTAIGTYDPRTGTYDPRTGTYDPRYPVDRNGGWDREHDGEHHDWERRGDRRQREWERNRGRHGDDDGDDENDDDGDNNDNDDGDDDGGRNGRYDGRYDPRGDRQGCVDMNRDGICDSRQIPMTAARILFP